MPEPPPQDFPPGPNEPTDDLVIEDVRIERDPDLTFRPLRVTLTVRNTTDPTRRFLVPDVNDPRVVQAEEGAQLTYLRLPFAEDGADVDRSATPTGAAAVAVAAGETHTVEAVLPVYPSQLTERVQVCVEVLPPPAAGAPAENEASGERSEAAPFYDEPGDGPVPVACSDWIEVPLEDPA